MLIFQTNLLNEVSHPTTTVLPLSTHLIDESYPLRFRVQKRDKLDTTSEILCDQIRTIDNQRIINKKLTTLTHEELEQINRQMMIVLELD